MSEITKGQKKAYLKGAERLGSQCPFCDSFDVSREVAELGEMWIRVDVECEKCGENWTDIYKLVDVEGYNDDC